MTESKAKHKFIIYLTLIIVILGFGGAAVFNKWLPEQYSPFYPGIPIFFYLYGLIYIHLYELFPDKLLFLHIIGKSAKLILGIIFVIAYIHFIGIHIKAYMITFLCYYMIYLIFESYFFLKLEMKMKKEKKK